MKSRHLILLLVTAGGLFPACHRDPDGDKRETQDTSDTAHVDTAESGDTGESGDTKETEDTGETGDTEDPVETGPLDTDDTGALPVEINEVARLTVYSEDSVGLLGRPYVLGDVTGDGVDDLCFFEEGGSPDMCAGFRSPVSAGVYEAGEADFTLEAGEGLYFAAPGDLNADGIDDLATENLVFLGPVEDLEPLRAADITLLYDDYYEPLSWQNNQGDSNGDGIDDLILTLQWWDEPTGARTDDLYVYSGLYSAVIDDRAYISKIYNSDGNWELGFMGDTNGDGYDDIAYGRDNLALGPLSSIVRFPDTTFHDACDGLRSLGDVNGDGYDDVASDGYVSIRYGVQVYHGPFEERVAWEDAIAGMFKEEWASSDGLTSTSSTGDQNGDSLPDLAFVTTDASEGVLDTVYLWESPFEGLHTTRHATIALESSASHLRNTYLDGPGDFTGDGSANDFLVGDYYNSAFAPQGGVGWVMIGGSLY